MGSPTVDISWPSSSIESFNRSFNIQIDEGNSAYTESKKSPACYHQNIPKPPPLPRKKLNRACSSIPKETKDVFKEGFGADVHIMTDDGLILLLIKVFWFCKNSIMPSHVTEACDAPRLALVCLRMVSRDFKCISRTEAWKVMRSANPHLEQELLESAVEADSRRQERLKKVEERKVYIQLHEALLHICRTIGPRDKALRGSQAACGFTACKGLETLIRHFSGCKTKVPGGCVHCKRMWQLLELHSRMCDEPECCKVPLYRHFKVKMQQQSNKEEVKWRVLVTNVRAA